MITIPKSRLRRFLFFSTTQFVSYFLFVANARAAAMGSYPWTALTDMIWTVQSFVIGKLLVENREARDIWSGVGFTVGGTAGSLLSIYVTKRLYGR